MFYFLPRLGLKISQMICPQISAKVLLFVIYHFDPPVWIPFAPEYEFWCLEMGEMGCCD